MKKFALLLICFCFLLLLGCSLKDQTSQSAANQGVKDADDVQTPTSEELDPMDKKPEKELRSETLRIPIAITQNQSQKKKRRQ